MTNPLQLRVELRLRIEGWPYEFVTDPGMEQVLADGRERVALLHRSGIGFGERVVPFEARLEGEAMTVTIIDRHRDHAGTAAMFKRPTRTMYLTADSGLGASFEFTSTAGWSAGERFHIGTEVVEIGTVASGTEFTGCSRAEWSTSIQAHFAGDSDSLAAAIATDQPLSLEGRRATLFLYTNMGDLQGDGEIVWRGICLTDAKLEADGTSWTLSIDPISRVLEQDLGADLEEPFAPRGIYYSAHNPFRIALGETDTTGILGYTDSTTGYGWVYGFFPNEAAFCDAVNAELATIISDESLTMQDARIIPLLGGEGYYFQVTVAAASPLYPLLRLGSKCDPGLRAGPTAADPLVSEDGSDARTVAAGGTYFSRRSRESEFNSTVPRGYFGTYTPTGGLGGEVIDLLPDPDPPDEATYPPTRVYLAGARSIAAVGAARVKLARADTELDEGELWATPDVTDRFVDLNADFAFAIPAGAYDRVHPLTLECARVYGTAADDIWGFMSNLMADSVSEANRGGTPFILSGTDVTDWTDAVTQASRGRPYLTYRRFIVPNGVMLSDYLAHHLRAYGLFPVINTLGQIDVVPIRPLTASQVTTLTIDATVAGVDGGFATWERNAFGTLNTVLFRGGYYAMEDEFRTQTSVRDADAYARRKSPRILEIAPKSQFGGLRSATVLSGGGVSMADYVDMAAVHLAVFGRDYAVVSVDVPIAAIGLEMGSLVSLDMAHLPNGLGGRGLTKVAQLIGRRFDFDMGRARLDLLVSYEDIAGYTPACYVSAESNISGNTWDLTVVGTDPHTIKSAWQSTDFLSDHFAAGDAVRVWIWNSGSGGVLQGTVVSVTDGAPGGNGTVRVTFSGVWVPAAEDWILGFDSAPSATAGQQKYAFIAGSDLLIDFSTAREAQVYA